MDNTVKIDKVVVKCDMIVYTKFIIKILKLGCKP